MEILFVLIPVSLLIVLVALYAFVWSVKNGQFDDLEKEGQRILSVERNEAEYRKYEVELGAADNDDNTDVKQQEANSLI
jgi:cbb3-type cytochrome oxidase maturation protein